MRDDKPDNLIVKLTYAFALRIMEFNDVLIFEKKYNMANQLFRSGTSIAANVREAQNGESKNDFIHKMKIAAKEADETVLWLSLCKDYPGHPCDNRMLSELETIQKILSKIISTSKKANR